MVHDPAAALFAGSIRLSFGEIWTDAVFIGNMPGKRRSDRCVATVYPAAHSRHFFWQFEEAHSVEAIAEGVMQIISSELKIPLERLTPDTKLQDIGVTSLDLIFIIFALEEKFDISIPYNANEVAAADERASSKAGLPKLESIAQIAAAVKGLMDAKASE